MLQTKMISSLGKVFPDEIQGREWKEGTVLCNEPISFQVAYRSCNTDNQNLPVYIEIDSDLDSKWITCYKVGYVPILNAHRYETDSYYSRTTPGIYPDPLFRRNTKNVVRVEDPWAGQRFEVEEKNPLTAIPTSYQALWFTVNEEGEKIPEGEHEIRISFFDSLTGEVVAQEIFRLRVLPAELVPQNVEYTTWMQMDCLADTYHVEMFGEKHFEIIASFVKEAARHGITMLLLPAFTPPLDTPIGKERMTAQLVKVMLEEGEYRFDFSLMKRFITVCRENGIKHFEHCHLFTQWGAKHAPKIIGWIDGEEKQLFGWETDSLGAEYGIFLRSYLRALVGFLEEMKIGKEEILFHISDEPAEKDMEYYKNALRIIRECVGGYHIGDAITHYEFYENGYIETPIVGHTSPHLQQFIDNCNRFWVYYTGGHREAGYANRLITNTAARNRILGIQMYASGAGGFLHWGYNFYYDYMSHGLFNPFSNPCGYRQISGASFVVYPQTDGTAVPSMRMKVQNEAFLDYRALETLEQYLGREGVLAFLQEMAGNISYEDVWDEKKLLDLRANINAKIEEFL